MPVRGRSFVGPLQRSHEFYKEGLGGELGLQTMESSPIKASLLHRECYPSLRTGNGAGRIDGAACRTLM